MFVSVGTGIRSVSFRGDILTIGTGSGVVLFYDLRATKYMHFNDRPGEIMFKTNTGWVVRTFYFIILSKYRGLLNYILRLMTEKRCYNSNDLRSIQFFSDTDLFYFNLMLKIC